MTTNRKKKVLIVEDETFLGELYSELLRKSGYDVEVVVDGEEALRRLCVKYFDLVWLDIMLPRLDGISVLEGLNRLQIKQGFIVFVTNLGQEAVIKRGFELGADSYLVKSSYTSDQILKEFEVMINSPSLPVRESSNMAIFDPDPRFLEATKDEIDQMKKEWGEFAKKIRISKGV